MVDVCAFITFTAIDILCLCVCRISCLLSVLKIAFVVFALFALPPISILFHFVVCDGLAAAMSAAIAVSCAASVRFESERMIFALTRCDEQLLKNNKTARMLLICPPTHQNSFLSFESNFHFEHKIAVLFFFCLFQWYSRSSNSSLSCAGRQVRWVPFDWWPTNKHENDFAKDNENVI